jgi:hypothetical protein
VKVLDWLCAVIVLALGVVHCAVTPFLYHAFSTSALWFFAAGLALSFGGMLNILRLKGAGSPLARTFALIANACMLAFALAFALKVNLSRNPQGIVLIVVLAGELLFSLRGRK